MEETDIRPTVEALARAMVSGEVAPEGREPPNFAAALLVARYPDLPVPEALCSFSLLLGMVVSAAQYRATELEEEK